jgi:hypothetical protein
MASFLKFVSGVYLLIVWLCVGIAVLAPVAPMTQDQGLIKVAAILAGIVLTVPAAALFAFAQLVEDTRFIRIHLASIRRYYEPPPQV